MLLWQAGDIMAGKCLKSRPLPARRAQIDSEWSDDHFCTHVAGRGPRKKIPEPEPKRPLFSFSFSLAPSWVPRGAPTSENAPSHGHKTYRDRDLRREEHLSEPTHTLGRHRAREWQPVQDKRFLLARETSTISAA